MKELLTHSRMSSFKECRRLHYFEYELGLRPVDDARALRMGSAFHAGIERLPDLDAACAAVREHYVTPPEGFDLYRWEIEQETVLRLVCGYLWRWDGQLEYIHREHQFRLPLINPATGGEAKFFDLAGKIDAIVRLEDGRLAVKESKLLGDDISDDSDLWRRMRIDHQISLYIHAARQLGYDVATVLYDVTRKPTIAPTAIPLKDADGVKIVLDRSGERVKTANGKKWRETGDADQGYVLQTRPMTVEEWGEKLSADIQARPEFYFARREVPRLDQDIDEYRAEIWEVQQTLREAQRGQRWYRTVSFRTCPYCRHFSHCSEGLDVSTSAPQGFEFVTDKHPELESPNGVGIG